MKRLLSILLLMPFMIFAQKVKVNEYDKFIKQRRVEIEPVTILANDKANISLEFNSIGSDFYVLVGGYGWGVSAIDGGQQMIFLFSNDSTLAVKSIGLQSYDMSGVRSSYKHKYVLPLSAMEMLNRYDLVGIRKYNLKDYNDISISNEGSARIKKSCVLFMEELKKARVLHSLKPINLQDVAKYVGDSVVFTSKVYNTRYFESSENKPTVLDVNSNYTNPFVSIVIWDQDMKNFNNNPDLLYKNKEISVRGVVQLYNNVPQIIIHNRDQITVNTPIRLEDIALYAGDTVTVQGAVMSAKYYTEMPNAPTLLNMGGAYPDQLLTLVIDNKDRINFDMAPEAFYPNKELSVTGKVMMNNDKPQMIVRSKNQIRTKVSDGLAFAKNENKISIAEPVAQVVKQKNIQTDVKAEFPGGANALLSFLKTNLKCPETLSIGQRKTVITAFTIDEAGKVRDVKIVRSGGTKFDKEVLRVFGEMPTWTPQLKSGQATSSRITHQVIFSGVEELPTEAVANKN